MIGLGSNRLSVCRRGGMSVTQAGRGGMEWLAGNGLRERTPYSAQAMAALKAQFPTQWPTIRDYGFAHPALVPFINEDPMMVMSLIDGLGVRWLISSGTQYIDTGIIPDLNTQVNTRVILPTNVAVNGSDAITGVRVPDDYNSRFYVLSFMPNKIRMVLGATELNKNITLSNTKEYVGIFNEVGTHKSYVDGVSLGNNYGGTYNTNTASYYIFAVNRGTLVDWYGRFKIAYVEFIKAAGTFAKFVPCKNPNGTDYGMLDIVNARWYANAGSGSFTISETPASQTP